MSAPRPACRVLTCTRDMSADSIMCTTCWIGLPNINRVSVESTERAVKRRPTMDNKQRYQAAIASALRAAQAVRA